MMVSDKPKKITVKNAKNAKLNKLLGDLCKLSGFTKAFIFVYLW